MKLIELLPNFTAELQLACERLGRADLTAQLATVELDNNSYNLETRVAQLRLRHAVEKSEGAEPANGEPAPANESVILRHRYGVKAETDNAGRLRRLIVAHGTDIAEALGRFSPLRT
ncbi:MAG TPA: hypothetical protein VGT79_08630 [Xanthomonadaceae bacterium]|nr:hypothetical protein [Xanthomonadaceae bacterium]